MNRRLICLIAFVLALFLAGNAQAQDATWSGATGDHNWFTAGNWNEVPTEAHWAKIRNGLPGATIASEGAIARRVHIGYAEGGALTVDGGTLVVTEDDLLLGKNGGEGILNMISGSIEVARDFEVAGGNPGIVNMTGGTITVADDFEIPESEGDGVSIAQVHLDGGAIIIGGDLHMFEQGSLDITGGTLILDGDAVSAVQGYIDNGWITAYEGDGTVAMDYDVTNEGQTTLKAVHKLTPYPANGGFAAPGTVELSWTLPEPITPGDSVPVDVYFTEDLNKLLLFTDPASIQVVSSQSLSSVAVQTQPNTQYYWAIDSYIGDPNDPIYGPIFSFVADILPPDVDAGKDVVTWLAEGGRVGNLDATVIYGKDYTVQWTVVSEPDDPNNPDAVIADPGAEDTSITLSAAGEYVLQLDATDGEKSGSDTVTINVYNNGCEAAQSLPDYVPFPGDLNGDCVVDQLDLDILNEDWLNDNSLTDDWSTVD